MSRLVALAAFAAALLAAGRAEAYVGHYTNAFVAGKAVDGRAVAVMAGVHSDFPYNGADYDQVAVLVEGSAPRVVTARPKLAGIVVAPGEGRLAFAGEGVSFDLRFDSGQHTPRYYGDPADVGDLYLQSGLPRRGEEPGLVYTPFQLMRLTGGALSLDGRPVALDSLHGQAESGTIDAPDDPRFRSAYDYLAAPTLEPGYTFMGFSTRALHAGVDGVLGPYFVATGSDQFTLEGGGLVEDNPNGAPPPFDNTAGPPEALARWQTDLGPGTLNRALVRLRDRSDRELLALSETIKEDR